MGLFKKIGACMKPVYEFTFEVWHGNHQKHSHSVKLTDVSLSQAFARMTDLCLETQRLMNAGKKHRSVDIVLEYELRMISEIGYMNDDGKVFRR